MAPKELERRLSDLLEQFDKDEKLDINAIDEFESMNEEIDDGLDTDCDETMDDD